MFKQVVNPEMAHGRGNRGLVVCECCSVPKSFVTLLTGANTEGLGGCSGAQGLQQSLWPSPGCSIPEGKQRPKAPTCMGTSPHRSPPGLDPLAWDMQGSPGTRPGREMPRGPAGAAGAGSCRRWEPSFPAWPVLRARLLPNTNIGHTRGAGQS